MRLPAGWAVVAACLLSAAAAHAQGAGPYYGPPGSPQARADLDGPYEPYGTPAAPRRGDGASLMPPYEAYQVLRETGFSPIGVPRLRGYTYVITAIDRRGDYGRLLLDARTGEVITFTPAYRMSENYEADIGPYGPRGAQPMPPPGPPVVIAAPRPPAPIPHVASRAVPMPPRAAAPIAGAQQGAAAAVPQTAPIAAPKPAPVPAATAAVAPPSAPPAVAAPRPAPPPAVAAAPAAPANTVGEAKPVPQIMPTQPMPEAQGLEY